MNQCANTTYLAEYESSLVESDERYSDIARRAAEMLEISGECHPWAIDNFREAISQCKDIDILMSLSNIRAAILGCNLDNPHANMAALSELKKVVEKYWHDVALCIAEKEKR